MFNKNRAWTVVFLLWIAFCINYIDRQFYFSIFPALRRDLGFTEAQLGFGGSIFAWVSAVCTILAGRAADMVRRDRLVVTSIILWSLVVFATSLSSSAFWFLIFRGTLGITESLYFPAAVALIADLHAKETRSKALAIHQSAQIIGTVGGGWYGGWIADRVGWRSGFADLAVVGIAYAVVLALAFRSVPSKQERTSFDLGILPLLRSRSYLAISFVMFVFCVTIWIVYAWLPDFIYHRFHLSMADSGLIATSYVQLSCAVGAIASGAIADKLSQIVGPARSYVLAVGTLLSAPFAYLMFAVHSLLLLKIIAIAFGFFAGAVIGNLFSSAYDVIPERNYGAGAGILNTIGGISSGAGMLLVGIWKAKVGFEPLVGCASIFNIVGGILLILVARRYFASDRRVALEPALASASIS